MPLQANSITAAELEMLAYATLHETIVNRKDPVKLDRVSRPTFNFMMSKTKKSGAPIRGGFSFLVKGRRNQRLTYWDGMDVLPFEEQYTGQKLKYYVGMAHMGDMMPYDALKRAGVDIDYSKGVRPGQVSASTAEIVLNVLKETREDIQENLEYEWAKDLMRSNLSSPKAPTGIDGLLPVTNPTGGMIGGQSRTNPMFQHRVSTGWTGDNFLSNISVFLNRLSRKSPTSSGINLVPVGDNVYDLLVNLYTGGTAAGGPANVSAGKIDFQRMQDKAQKTGEKYKIGLPDTCFELPNGTMILNDPMFAVLAEEDPTAGWASRGYCLNTEHLFVIPVKVSEDPIVHPMPYNQRVQHASWHLEWTLACTAPNTQGVFTVNYGGLGLPGA
jgi:hypothetical protein